MLSNNAQNILAYYKKIETELQVIERNLDITNTKLSNESFINKAKKDIVELEYQKQRDMSNKVEFYKESLQNKEFLLLQKIEQLYNILDSCEDIIVTINIRIDSWRKKGSSVSPYLLWKASEEASIQLKRVGFIMLSIESIINELNNKWRT
jgi:hypothetical protein